MVTVAQLVEPRIVIPVVVGSSPISHPTFCIIDLSVVGLNVAGCRWDRSVKALIIIQKSNACESGGIGRRAGFRFQCLTA